MVAGGGGKSPVMQLNNVVLPAPLEPSTARRSPGRTVRVTSVSAASAPNSRVTPRNSSAAPAPTVDRRCATLSMVRTVFRGAGVVSSAPALPQPDDAAPRPTVQTVLRGDGVVSAAPALRRPDDAGRREQHDDEKAEADQKAEAI